MARRSLRLRLAVTFGLTALLVSTVLASATYLGVRHYLVADTESTDLHQSFANADLVRDTLYNAPLTIDNLLNSLQRSTNSAVLVKTDNQWLSVSSGALRGDVSNASIVDAAHAHASTQTQQLGGQLLYVVAIPIPSVQSDLFEVFNLSSLDVTLHTLALFLGLAALVTTLLGVIAGSWLARRSVRPLLEVSRAAARIAEGDLETRLLESHGDIEVQHLTSSFNSMVEQLSLRLKRDARFAGDVSHELRSPLTALATSVTVLAGERDRLSEGGATALTLLTDDLQLFQSLVEDLLEMARLDAGAATVNLELVDARRLLARSVASSATRLGIDAPDITWSEDATGALLLVDRRRFERVVSNLLENAVRYAGAVAAVRVECRDDQLVINVDDAGPGIAADERTAVFERFFRGRAAFDRKTVRGTGIGLALVRDHLALFEGTVEATGSPEGGARVSIRLPLREGSDS